MRGSYVEDLKTPLTKLEAALALRHAVETVTAVVPSRLALAVLMAQTALETARWLAIHRFNWGNVKASQRWAGQYTCFRCNEVIDGAVRWFSPEGAERPKGTIIEPFYEVPPGHPQTRFCAFETAAVGAVHFIRFLAVDTDGDGRNRYAAAWVAAMRGDAEAYCIELRKAGYYTADLDPYLRGVRLMTKEFGEWLRGKPGVLEEPEQEEVKRCIGECCRTEIDIDSIPFYWTDWWEESRRLRDEAIRDKF
jgi:hypothetical protein